MPGPRSTRPSGDQLAEGIRFVQGEFDEDQAFKQLSATLDELDEQRGTRGNHAFYLSIPPKAFERVCRQLSKHGLAQAEGGNWRRVLIEKPFGHDIESARQLNDVVESVFPPDAVFRIDHYLGKETVQNILALRFANQLFEPLWNANYVDHVQITMAEAIGTGGRAGYNDGVGAARDVIQSEVIILRGYGELAAESESLVAGLLLPDAPIVAWWPRGAPNNASETSIGRIAHRRITDSANEGEPNVALENIRNTYKAGDTDPAWTRLTNWRIQLAAALDNVDTSPVTAVTVEGASDSASTLLLAAWLTLSLEAPVTVVAEREGTGIRSVRLSRDTGDVQLSRPDRSVTELTQLGQPTSGSPCPAAPSRRVSPKNSAASTPTRSSVKQFAVSVLSGCTRKQRDTVTGIRGCAPVRWPRCVSRRRAS
jgi:glucose-6-phosphate dehydrogenase assembly protein OpcA